MGIKPNVVRLSMKHKADAEKQIFGFDRRLVRQAEFPKRHLIGALLGIVRIEIDESHYAIVMCRRHPGEGNNVVVRGVEDKDVAQSCNAGFSWRIRLARECDP
jgi:hypothetical protein